ncbi:two-component response regulator ARR14 [Lactuca sativa]|uniref:two-component response regulator ARR14 n=1 Tax=Lactuca sativa TaxID=4236 RepID=UPI001C6898B9|nr:two-component response regulator ARR14 [Lactuca sativa]
MSEQEDDAFLFEALKNGAFLVLKRPLTIDAVRHMRQDIIRERIHKHEKCKKKNMVVKATTQATPIQENIRSGRKRKETCGPMKQVINKTNIDNNLLYQSSEEEEEDDDDDDDSTQKRVCLEWTPELHKKFLDAISELGEGRCFPKEILNLMDVPGLTRMQVASHLQKCRKEKWKVNERGRTPTSSNSSTLSSNVSPLEVSGRKFGCMPLIQTDKNVKEDHSSVIGINLSINGWQIDEKHKNEQTPRVLPIMNEFIQKNIVQPTPDILFPLGNGFDSNQDEGIGSKITKSTNNYFLQAISGSHDVGEGVSDPYNLSSIPRQTSDDFPDYLKDMDGNGPNDDLIS